jgi:glycosyltransferase involved in cell wall biosynthesis
MPPSGTSAGTPDVAVVTQDPRFGGGALYQLRAFIGGIEAIGRVPTVLHARRPPLAGPFPLHDVTVLETSSRLGRVDTTGILLGARRLVPTVAQAKSVWVSATVAFYGLPALRSGRRYACWIGTTYESEQRGRRPGLDVGRRLSTRINGLALRRWERAVLENAAIVLAPTEQIAAELHVAAGGSKQVGVLPIPIDTSRFRPLEDGEWTSGPPRLVFVGRADDPRKNVGLLLDAFARARETLPDLELRLVGRPPKEELPAGAVSVGEVGDVAAHMRDARLLVLPSTQEGFGIVAAEALASGVPVVTTPCGGPAETVSRSGGGAVLAGFDPDELAHVVVDLIEDEPALVAMRQAGRRHAVDAYGIERFERTLAAAMDELDRGG